jgi:hypothetical protein
LDGEDVLARARQVERWVDDEGRERPRSERAAKVVLKAREERPEEGGSSGGYRVGGGLNHHRSPRTREWSKALETGTTSWRHRATGGRGFV